MISFSGKVKIELGTAKHLIHDTVSESRAWLRPRLFKYTCVLFVKSLSYLLPDMPVLQKHYSHQLSNANACILRELFIWSATMHCCHTDPILPCSWGNRQRDNNSQKRDPKRGAITIFYATLFAVAVNADLWVLS